MTDSRLPDVDLNPIAVLSFSGEGSLRRDKSRFLTRHSESRLMELPFRSAGDVLLPPGEMTDIRRRLRAVSSRHDLASVIVSAFDHRTRILPFIYADTRMAPAGVRAIGSAMLDAGFEKTRIVLQQWNRHFRPQQMRLDNRVPDIFMVSSMHLHSTTCDELIQDACKMDAETRPLIIAGGPRVIYSPWEVFGADPDHPWGADVAVTGEEYVLLRLLEVLLALCGTRESMRSVFVRARDAGALDEIPGLVYSRSTVRNGAPEELVDTGVQRLLADLDELPFATLGYRLLEPPSSQAHVGGACSDAEPNPPTQSRVVPGDDGRLQVPLLVLPDTGLQPTAASCEER